MVGLNWGGGNQKKKTPKCTDMKCNCTLTMMFEFFHFFNATIAVNYWRNQYKQMVDADYFKVLVTALRCAGGRTSSAEQSCILVSRQPF